MNMSLRMEQRTPPQWQSIIDLVADKHTMRRMAEYRMHSGITYMRDELFLYLADHWVVRSELNLDYANSVDRGRLETLLQEADFDVNRHGDRCLTVDLDGYSIRLKMEEKGHTRICPNTPLLQGVCVNLREESIVVLLRFIGEAMPVMEDMAEDIVLEKQQETAVSTIYGQVLRIKLDELGAQYSMEADEKFITVNVRLKPDHQLRFCVRSEQAREMADKVEGLIAAANLLNGEYWTTGMRIV